MKENVFPWPSISPLNFPSSMPGEPEVTVWRISSLFVQDTFVPTFTFSGVGSNLKVLTLTVVALAAAGDEDVAGVAFEVLGVDVGLSSPPQAAEMANIATAADAISSGRKRLCERRFVVT